MLYYFYPSVYYSTPLSLLDAASICDKIRKISLYYSLCLSNYKEFTLSTFNLSFSMNLCCREFFLLRSRFLTVKLNDYTLLAYRIFPIETFCIWKSWSSLPWSIPILIPKSTQPHQPSLKKRSSLHPSHSNSPQPIQHPCQFT